MSSRVSLPLISRPIGLALPASTFRPCGLVLAVLINGWCRVLPHTSSHALVVAFGTCPPQSSPCLRRARLGRLFLIAASRKRATTTWRHHLTEPSALRSTTCTSLCRPSLPHCCDRMPLRAFGITLPSGPFDACQPARSRDRPCDLAAARRPTGITSPGSSRVTSLPAISQTGSSMGTHPSEASPHSSPPDPLGSSCPPCRFPPCGAAAPRIRAVSGPSRLAARWLPRMGAFTDDGVVHTADRSLLSWSFSPSRMTFRPRPTLLQGSSHGLFSSTRAWDSPQGCPRASSYAQIYVRSSEFQRTGSPPGFTRASLRGVPAASHPP